MKLAPRRGHILTREALYHVIVFAIAASALAVALQSSGRQVPVLSPEPQTKVVAPASPGLARAIDICKFGEVSRLRTETGSGYTYTAIFGLDVLRWPDDPPGKQPLAIVNGDTVMLSDEVQKCLTDKF